MPSVAGGGEEELGGEARGLCWREGGRERGRREGRTGRAGKYVNGFGYGNGFEPEW